MTSSRRGGSAASELSTSEGKKLAPAWMATAACSGSMIVVSKPYMCCGGTRRQDGGPGAVRGAQCETLGGRAGGGDQCAPGLRMRGRLGGRARGEADRDDAVERNGGHLAAPGREGEAPGRAGLPAGEPVGRGAIRQDVGAGCVAASASAGPARHRH